MVVELYKGITKEGENEKMAVEDWLMKKDEYVPIDDKDRFIDKTIAGILKILSRIKRERRYSEGVIYKLNPSLKLIFTILIIVFLSMSRSFFYVFLVDTYFLLILSLLEGEEIKKILAVSVIIPLFTLIMLLPSIFMGNVQNSMLLLLKVAGTVISINILSYTTKWHHITKALKKFFIPDIFIFVFDITIKYIYVLGEFALEMFYALKIRSVGKNNNKYISLSRIMGNLFLKSKNMGDEMYSAMECRGFTGNYNSYSKFKMRFKDVLYCIVNIIIILLYFCINILFQY
ncbi:energy-coupling factor transporter transmembrane component T [Haloimpatiens sp. FM7330]|uniref:energy-coupling factor transporter transmembrane component T n=1 Tax=Haloimpatiens sp. FM7330 TaxID=3298610 RepID=UPI0036279D59